MRKTHPVYVGVCVIICVCTHLYIVDVPVVVYGGGTVINIVELAPYLDIFETFHLPA